MYKLTFSTEIGILLKNNWIEIRHRRVADVKSDFLLAIKKNHIRWQMRSKKHKLSLLLIRKKYDNVYIFYVQLNKCVYLYLVLVFFLTFSARTSFVSPPFTKIEINFPVNTLWIYKNAKKSLDVSTWICRWQLTLTKDKS